MSLNKFMVIGNLGNSPEVRRLENGTAVANFSLATSEKYKDKNGGVVSKTEWHKIILWRQLAELAEKYLKKGSQIYVEGKITTRKYKDKDGVEKYTTELVGSQMRFLGGKSDSTNQSTPEPATSGGTAAEEGDQLPF